MAEERDSGERTEEPTARRLQKARDDGQVPRSTELTAAAVVIAAMGLFFGGGAWLFGSLSETFASGFAFDRQLIETPAMLPAFFIAKLGQSYLVILPLLLMTMLVAVAAAGSSGGFVLSWKAAAPKWSKLSPINGFKRMFGPKAGVELLKAIAKFLLVGAMLTWVVSDSLTTLTTIGRMNLQPAMALAGELIARSALLVSLALAAIAFIDVPYQHYDFTKRMRMTRQEVRDEMKDVEGRPEVRAHIRRRQREIATNKMMTRVKEADVVITNPQHFAVALSYDPSGDGAPIVVAKGPDHLALRIREEADRHGVHRFESPALARALYFTTEVDQQVPEDLYYAVAQVIAYVFSLSSMRRDGAQVRKPAPTVPRSMRFDAEGRPEAETVGA
jgi:flagellar biosynthesis protein FlhB